jgi:hypothetical protein
MPSPEFPLGDVSVILHKESSLLIPPSPLQREPRHTRETFEAAALRLCRNLNVSGHIDSVIATKGLENAPTMAYLVRPYKTELDDHEHLVSRELVEETLKAHPLLSETDRRLFQLAFDILNRQTPTPGQPG